MLPKETMSSFACCYTVWQALQVFQNFLNHACPPLCSKEMPTGICRIKKKKERKEERERESRLKVWEGWVQKPSKELNKFILQFLFWKVVQSCYSICHLRIFLYGKCLHLSHYYPFQRLPQANEQQHFRCLWRSLIICTNDNLLQ